MDHDTPYARARPLTGPASSRAVRPLTRLRAVVAPADTPLYANAYALLANQVSSAALGFLYWMIAARLYSVDVVGRSSAVISTLLLIAAISQLGLDAGMVRFVPRAGRNARRLVLGAYLVVPSYAAVLSIAFLLISRASGFGEKLVGDLLPPWLLIAATVAWSVFTLQDATLNGLRRSVWVLGENLIYNVSKIVLLVLGVVLLKDAGIVGSWFLPTLVSIALVGWLVFGRFLKADSEAALETHAEGITRREVVRSVSGDHLGSIIAEASIRLLPLLVVALLGAKANAFFYQGWIVAYTFALAANSMSSSFSAHASGDMANIAGHSRAILRQMLLVLVPAALLVAALAPTILSLFGRAYASEATQLLRLLALGVPLVVFDVWYLSYERVRGNIRRVVAVQAVGAGLLLGLAYLTVGRLGITGIAVAWLASRAAIAVAALPQARVLFAHGPHDNAANAPRTSLQADTTAIATDPAQPADPPATPAVLREAGATDIFLSPHLDDAVLSCGAGIARLTSSGRDVLIVTVYTGDSTPWPEPTEATRRCWALDAAPFVERRLEDASAVAVLGARLMHLGFTDALYRADSAGVPLYPLHVIGGVAAGDEDRLLPALRKALSALLAETPHRRVFCPAGVGGHVDHTLVRRAAEAVCDDAELVLYEEYPYLSRHDSSGGGREGSLWVLTPTPTEIDQRIAATAQYRSQLRKLFPSPYERYAEIAAARYRALRPVVLGPDRHSGTVRVARRLERDLEQFGGERYWAHDGAGEPFARE
jgi:LmbE family N-acetylglucosaminyl deacetylase/O-antigen/teichoic acid export membrane protein